MVVCSFLRNCSGSRRRWATVDETSCVENERFRGRGRGMQSHAELPDDSRGQRTPSVIAHGDRGVSQQHKARALSAGDVPRAPRGVCDGACPRDSNVGVPATSPARAQ